MVSESAFPLRDYSPRFQNDFPMKRDCQHVFQGHTLMPGSGHDDSGSTYTSFTMAFVSSIGSSSCTIWPRFKDAVLAALPTAVHHERKNWLMAKELRVSKIMWTSASRLPTVDVVSDIKHLGFCQNVVTLRSRARAGPDSRTVQAWKSFLSQETRRERFVWIAGIIVHPILHPLGKLQFFPAFVGSTC